MEIYTDKKIAPVGQLNMEDLKKMGMNVLIFTAPALIVFFGQLALKVPIKDAALVALLAFYGIIADALKKLKQTP